MPMPMPTRALPTLGAWAFCCLFSPQWVSEGTLWGHQLRLAQGGAG